MSSNEQGSAALATGTSPDEPGTIDVATGTSSSRIPKKEPTQKKIWMLTYCPAGTYITVEMLKKHGITADECHSTCDRVMNYTYLHLEKRCRIPAIEKFLAAAQREYGIIKNEVFGYDCIGTKSNGPGSVKIQDHVVFKMLVAHSKERNPSFSPCTDGDSVLKRGHLFHAHETIEHMSVPLEKQSKIQLVAYARRLEERLKSTEATERELHDMTEIYMQVSRDRTNLRLENQSLRLENAALKRKIGDLEH